MTLTQPQNGVIPNYTRVSYTESARQKQPSIVFRTRARPQSCTESVGGDWHPEHTLLENVFLVTLSQQFTNMAEAGEDDGADSRGDTAGNMGGRTGTAVPRNISRFLLLLNHFLPEENGMVQAWVDHFVTPITLP